jgi:general stress protein 26
MVDHRKSRAEHLRRSKGSACATRRAQTEQTTTSRAMLSADSSRLWREVKKNSKKLKEIRKKLKKNRKN